MRKKLFLSTLAIIFSTLILSMLSVNLVFQRQFTNYLTQTTETTIQQLPDRLSALYQSKGGWDPELLNDLSHTLPIGAEVVLKDQNNRILFTLTNPMEEMMRGANGMGMGMGMGMSMGMNMEMSMGYSVKEWKTKTLAVDGPNGVIAVAHVRYPASARILNPQDITFVSAIFRSLFIAGLLALLIGILLSYMISRKLAAPLIRLTKAVHRVGEGNLDDRVDVNSKDEVGQLALAFNTMADSLKKQEHLRKQFTADIAHELRTPLTSIKSYIEAFQDGVFQPDPENLAIINEEIERLVLLSSDLKDLNVAEMGELEPNFHEVNLGELLRKIGDKLYPLIQEKSINLRWEIPQEPLLIQGDEHLLTRLFYNLIHNAYKYNEPNGKIVIQAENKNTSVLIRVKDSGFGIPENELPYIFERFYRADKSRSRETGGTGIGLALVKQITLLHKGTIKVQSKLNHGSEFTVILPQNNLGVV